MQAGQGKRVVTKNDNDDGLDNTTGVINENVNDGNDDCVDDDDGDDDNNDRDDVKHEVDDCDHDAENGDEAR